MGLGTSNDGEKGLYLAIAGGFIWDRKADESHPQFRTQEYEFSGETKTRQGAQYSDFTGTVSKVEVKQGTYGEQLLVTMESGGENYIFSLGTNNRNSQNFFSALLVMDLTQPINVKPYDFEGKDDATKKPTGKRVVGITFKQGGQKLDLKAVEGMPTAGDEIYKSGNNKKIKRWFEDLNDWYVEQVNEKIVPQLIASTPSANAIGGSGGSVPPRPTAKVADAIGGSGGSVPPRPTAKVADAIGGSGGSVPPRPTAKVATPIKMKKFLKNYILENYGEDEALPKLSKEELVSWYDLAQNEEELPFPSSEVSEQVQEAEVPKDELGDQLANLLG